MDNEQGAHDAPNLSTHKPDVPTPVCKTDEPRGVRGENVRDMDLRSFICVTPDTTLADAFARMEAADTDDIFVCDGNQVIGLFSQHAALAHIGTGKFDANAVVRDLMIPDFVKLPADSTTVGRVVETMNERRVRHIAITDGEDFIGSVSDLDIITFLVESYPKETMNLPPVAAQMLETREGE